MPKTKLINSAGITATIGLASLPAFLTLAPLVAPNGAFADEPTANVEEDGLITLSVIPALAITAQPITISATPTVGNTFITTTSTINVKNTGSGGGYHLIMSSDSSSLTNESDVNKRVNTISGYSRTGGEMRNSTTSSWGWTMQSVSGTNAAPSTDNGGDIVNTYYPIPTSSTSWNSDANQSTNTYAYLKNTTDYTNKTDGDNITVGYAFAIGPDISAGTYTDTITYTAIPNRDNKTIFDMANMQDLASYPDACYNTPTPAVRTGDIPDTAVVDSINSMTGYGIRQTNIDKIPTVTLTDTRDGNTYTVKKLADGHCWMTTSLKIADTAIKADKSNVTVSDVGENGFALPATVAATVTRNTANTAYVSNGGTNGTYLYSWFAATAGTGTTNTAKNAPGDICPKGWQLPNGIGDMSWDRLLSVGQGVYEIATSDEKFSANMVMWGVFNKDGRGIGIASGNPLGLHGTGYFINSAFMNGGNGYYWSRTSTNNTNNAYSVGYDGSTLGVKATWIPKYSGLTIRCVSR